jgi:hypothetical protein
MSKNRQYGSRTPLTPDDGAPILLPRARKIGHTETISDTWLRMSALFPQCLMNSAPIRP